MATGLRWFRFYVDATSDEKLGLIAPSDRWHYVAVLCLKADGLLDEGGGELRARKIAYKLGLSLPEADEVRRRLREVGLIDDDWQPLGWERRQYRHDSSAERTREWRRRKAETPPARHGDVTVTGPETETETETECVERARARGTHSGRLPPPDWKPLPAVLETIRMAHPHIDVDAELERFRDYEQTRPRSDWDAAFRKFCAHARAPAVGSNEWGELLALVSDCGTAAARARPAINTAVALLGGWRRLGRLSARDLAGLQPAFMRALRDVSQR